jgi:hypothetical protein
LSYPVVDFEFFGFIALVWILVEINHTQDRLDRLYVEQMGAIKRRRWNRVAE